MGLMIIIGGVVGTILGIISFTFKETGKLVWSFLYLTCIFSYNWYFNAIEGAKEIDREEKINFKTKLHTHYWIHGLPFKLRFPKSRLYESAFTPIFLE